MTQIYDAADSTTFTIAFGMSEHQNARRLTKRISMILSYSQHTLHLVEMHSIAVVGLMFIWTSYFMSLPVLYTISAFGKLTMNLRT